MEIEQNYYKMIGQFEDNNTGMRGTSLLLCSLLPTENKCTYIT